MNTLFLTLFRPVRALNQLKTEPFSAMSLVMILLLMLANLILLIPVSEKVLQIIMSSMSLNPAQADMAIELAYKMRYLQMAGTIILCAVMLLFYALILQLVVRISKRKLEYKKVFQLLVCCYVAVALGDVVNTVLLHVRGIDVIENMYDLSITGLSFFTSIEKVGATGYVFLSCFTPFQLWFVALLSIGLSIFAEMKLVKAIVISVLFWLITILFPVLSVYFSQATMARSGLM